MSLNEIINIIVKDGSGWLVVVMAMMSLVQISPIKVNPWTQLRLWLSSVFNKETSEKIETLENEVDDLKKSFEQMQQDTFEQKLDSIRMFIIDAARELKKNEGQVSDAIEIEYLSQVNKKCDLYEQICEEYHIPNGVATMSISYIREVYKRCVL